jgi:hypothetical protein
MKNYYEIESIEVENIINTVWSWKYKPLCHTRVHVVTMVTYTQYKNIKSHVGKFKIYVPEEDIIEFLFLAEDITSTRDIGGYMYII